MTHSYSARKIAQDFLSCTTNIKSELKIEVGINKKRSTQWVWMGIVEGKIDIKTKCLTNQNSVSQISHHFLCDGHSVNRIRIFIEFRHWCPCCAAYPGQATRISSCYLLARISLVFLTYHPLNMSSGGNYAAEIHSKNFCLSNCSPRDVVIIWKLCGGNPQ